MTHELLTRMLGDFEGSVKTLRSFHAYVEEQPQAKQSVRFAGHAFTDKKKRAYVKKLTLEIRGQYAGPVIAGHVRLTVLYSFPWRGEDWEAGMVGLEWALTDVNLDVDNLLKPLKDAMRGVVYKDDRQVVEVKARKIRYERGMIALKVDEVMPNRRWGLQPIG